MNIANDPDAQTQVLKALADATRVGILAALVERGDTCVCELVELLGTSDSSLSFHLTKLKGAGLVRARRVGKWMFYRPDRETAAKAREWLAALLDTSRTPDGPAEGSMAAICCGADVPVSRKEVTLRRKEGHLVAERM